VKKKSPPYAIIGAAVLGIIAVFIYLQHEKSVQAAAQAAMDKARADAQAAIEKANQQKPAPSVNEVQTHMRKVYYATQPIDPGVRISASFFETKLTPDNVLPDAYTEGPNVDLVGWFATRTIEKGDPLTPRNVGKVLPFMEGRIAPGMRAVALSVFNGGDPNATGGFVVDGDKVDLLATRITTDGNYQYDTQLFMQNLSVLYVPGTPTKTEETSGVNPIASAGQISIMVEVTPEQAQALIHMTHSKNMRLSMILRSRRDTTEAKIKPFVGMDYIENPKKLQTMTDKSITRVDELGKQIEEEEKKQGQGNTNETAPTPPSP